MNKVVTINLHGNAYQLEEAGYDALRAYLEDAARKLEGNPDKDEILGDIEQAIADKCQARLNGFRNVVSSQDITAILSEMGSVEGAESTAADPAGAKSTDTGPGTATPGATSGPRTPHRLFRLQEGAMIRGVCNGLAAYFGIDVTLVRLIFVVLALASVGTFVLLYIVLTLVVPLARTPEEKAAAWGEPNTTAHDFIRRAKEGYYEGTRTWGNRAEYREWKRNFRQEARDWRRNFRREMREKSWGWNQPCGTPPITVSPVLLALYPIFALIRVALVFFGLWIAYMVLTQHMIFGEALPSDVPWWLALIGVMLVFNLVLWPFRVMRRAVKWGGCASPWRPAYVGLTDMVLSFGVIALVLWFLSHHSTAVAHALQHFPALFHQLVDDIREWWSQK